MSFNCHMGALAETPMTAMLECTRRLVDKQGNKNSLGCLAQARSQWERFFFFNGEIANSEAVNSSAREIVGSDGWSTHQLQQLWRHRRTGNC